MPAVVSSGLAQKTQASDSDYRYPASLRRTPVFRQERYGQSETQWTSRDVCMRRYLPYCLRLPRAIVSVRFPQDHGTSSRLSDPPQTRAKSTHMWNEMRSVPHPGSLLFSSSAKLLSAIHQSREHRDTNNRRIDSDWK